MFATKNAAVAQGVSRKRARFLLAAAGVDLDRTRVAAKPLVLHENIPSLSA